MTKKEFIVEVNSADEGDILIWSPPKDLFPPIPIKNELVRCKDCKFYARNKNIFHRGSDCLKRIIDTIVPDVDFCSNAKRKEE